MGKLYFKYGAMGSSKTATALITQFNYEERGMQTWLIKPATDTRDGANIIRSRIGLEKEAMVFAPEDNITQAYNKIAPVEVIIADEAQFFTSEQITELRNIADIDGGPVVMCFGLRADFQRHLFPGSQRLLELADSIEEIKTMCADGCGRKGTVNARIDEKGELVIRGEQVMLGGNDSYIALCSKCYRKRYNEVMFKERWEI